MSRKIAYLRIKVVVESDNDEIDLDDVISNLDYEITSMTEGVNITYTEIVDREDV